MQKKFRAFAMTIPLLLFALGEQQAHPLPEIEDGTQPAETPAPAPVNKTEPAQQPSAAETTVGDRKTRRRPRGLARTNRRRSRQKSRRNSSASVAAQRLYILRREYARRTRRPLIVTSFRRSPSQQARATRNNIRRRGLAYVLALYKHSPAIREIANAYRANRRNPKQAQEQMTVVIENQIARGVYVSAHLRGEAADIRSRGRNGARLRILREVAHDVGAKVSVEPDHYHVRLV
jgi:hypothetical protein